MNLSVMIALVLALLIGVVSGLRSMTAPAAVSWAARLRWLHLEPTGLAFLGNTFMPPMLTIAAVGELAVDKLSATPSRRELGGFSTRLLSGGLSGSAIGATSGHLIGGLIAGVIGAVLGTLGGSVARARLAAAFGSDRPAAFVEDAVAIGCAVLIVAAQR
jgi:uncharacterized membrane protein